jgi:hypothetical protein
MRVTAHHFHLHRICGQNHDRCCVLWQLLPSVDVKARVLARCAQKEDCHEDETSLAAAGWNECEDVNPVQ